MNRSHLAVAGGATLLAAALLAHPAAGGSRPRADFAMDFSAKRPDAATAIRLKILYRGRDPHAKPSPIRRIVLKAPKGTRFDSGALPRCHASDQELMTYGDSACPAASRLGSGTLTAMTGLPGPAATVVTHVTIYNTATGNVELVKETSSGKPVATDRFRIQGRTWTAHPPDTPGGPPDGKTAVRRIDFTYAPKARWAVTPKGCPAGRRWRSTGAFTYADGVTARVPDRTPCTRPARR
jgi:hypothetical protein